MKEASFDWHEAARLEEVKGSSAEEAVEIELAVLPPKNRYARIEGGRA